MKLFEYIKFATLTASLVVLTSCADKKDGRIGDGPSVGGEDTPAVSESDMAQNRLDVDPNGISWSQFKDRVVHFDYDSATIKANERGVLEEVATWAKANPGAKIMVAGHCDEKGTAEYNMALGQRRASAGRAYLVKLGVAANRIGTVSRGEEEPVDKGHNDGAWAKNRRDEFGVIQ